MIQKGKVYHILTTVLLAAAFAGSGVHTVATALNMDVAVPVWTAAALGAALSGLMALSGLTAVVALILLGLISGGWALSHRAALQAIPALLSALQENVANGSGAQSGAALLIVAAMIFGLLCFLLLYRSGMSSLAIMLLASMLVFSHGMSRTASIAAALPGLVAVAAVFALGEGQPRDAMALRVFIPSALAVVLALMLLPAERVTWQPMEHLADQVRSMFEQYFNFTHERVAYSISEEGYNHGGEIEGQPVAMLGGPADPDPSPVMRVTSDGEMLLRGTIRSTYTGYSWVDVTPKNRYLYYDLTHKNVRDRVFNVDMGAEGAFSTATAQVELIDSATSTLFVPGRLQHFDMDLTNAVYYNSAGEMFMARQAQSGDRYSVEGLIPIFSTALRQATLRGEAEGDSQYDDILAANSQLPASIEMALIELTQQLTDSEICAYDKANAIAGYLRQNMRYRLDVVYPPQGRDFASWFVLESREGYCSYFATAMAVMGRIAGLPTRYVEGYRARSVEGGTVTLTGMDAHAWAEIYFKGLGWIPFDATNGGSGSGGPGSGEGEQEYGYASGDAQTEDTPFEDNSDTFDGENEDDASLAPDEEDDQQDDQDDSEGDEDSADADNGGAEDQPPEGQGTGGAIKVLIWLLILLLIGFFIFLIVTRLRRSDPFRLCGQARRAQQGALIAYRANLTLLGHMGHEPQSGESPDAFADRVCRELDNPDYAAFVKAVSYSRYGNRPLKKEDVDRGLRAYRRFLSQMRFGERLRLIRTRVLRGLGDFESIP